VTVIERVDAALERIGAMDGVVRAWTHLDPDRARREAVAAGARAAGPLTGLTLGVKDVFDSSDLPTEYGSPIYAGFRPRADAAAVALLRRAGAVVVGKTATTEFATFHPAPTTNPHRSTHTPGGSSSGSAAAVACGMVDVALGTQTTGSIVRPASFCGVFGFKPTFGVVSVAGLKLVAPRLDTVGWLARDVSLLDRVRVALTGAAAMTPIGPPRIARLVDDQWRHAEADSRSAVLEAVARAAAAGAETTEVALPAPVIGLGDEVPLVMAHEAARSLAWERDAHPELLSAELTALLDDGWSVPVAAHDEVWRRARAAVDALDELFGPADVVLAPSAAGEAPASLASTGDPRFARLWTLLGCPSLNVPGLVGSTGLPVGVQLIARPGADATLLAAGAWLAGQLPPPAVVHPV
jgi:Asp-tRNA(Asn)/Glu-tRNA(Gln) amidotransferase A subunit family amidase